MSFKKYISADNEGGIKNALSRWNRSTNTGPVEDVTMAEGAV